MTFRLRAILPTTQPQRPHANAREKQPCKSAGRRPVVFDDGDAATPCDVYERSSLAPGHCIAGPAIIEQMDTTTVVPAGFSALADPSGTFSSPEQDRSNERRATPCADRNRRRRARGGDCRNVREPHPKRVFAEYQGARRLLDGFVRHAGPHVVGRDPCASTSRLDAQTRSRGAGAVSDQHPEAGRRVFRQRSLYCRGHSSQ